MKKTKRLSIEFRHREVTITVNGSTLHVQNTEPDAANASALCPTCNSPWITVVAAADGDASASVGRIHRALQQAGLHVQVSPANRLQICQRSSEELKEKF